jgi:hypothetical protein
MPEYVLKWTEGNSKLEATSSDAVYRVLGYGIPADANFTDTDGKARNTCPSALACRGVCYAKQGRYTMTNVMAARAHNLTAWTERGADGFVAAAVADLTQLTRRYSVVRVHDSGDFFSQAYLDAWCRIAARFPAIIFYAYTKSLDLDFALTPLNLRVTQSLGGRHDTSMEPDFSHARIFATEEDRIAAGYVDGSHSDAPAIEGLVNIGLVYHGTRKMTDSQKKYFS